MSSLLEAALGYARSGFYVFPVEPPAPGDPKSGKSPIGSLVRNGKDDATRDEQVIRMWWSSVPNANIGIATARSNLIVLDVDVSGAKRGRESLASIDSQLEPTLTAVTGSGGIHAYYSRGVYEPFQRIGALPGIDLIGNGYVIAPPSLHASGKEYAWANQTSIAPVPSVLVNLKHEPAAKIAAADVGRVPIVEGGRNNALFRLGASLRATGINRDALRAALHLENRERFKPQLPDDEVEQIAASVMVRVHPERDVAAGAVVAEELRDLFASEIPESVAMWIRDVAAKPAPLMRWYSTGNAQLDALLGGGVASTHVCGVVGPPSVGKSAFVSSVCMFLQTELPVLHISTELARRELMIRYAANRRSFAWREGMRGKHDHELQEAVKDLRIKMIGSDTLDRTDPLGMIIREALSIKEEFGISPAIVIDYVQLLARGNEDGMRSRVGELTMKIRIMAQALDCPVIAVFSTGRGFYGGGKLELLRQANDPTAYLSAAKESGDIEFDCATILFLDVDQLVEGATKPARAVVARCRVGDIGFAGYRANLAIGRWEADPLANAEMQNEEKTRKKAESEQMKDDQAVLEVIRNNPTLPWGVLRDDHLMGIMGHAKADAVKGRLIRNRIVESVVEYDEAARRRTVLKIRK